MTFGTKIRDLRRERRMTQRDLADKLQSRGLRADFTYISKIENDKLEFPPSEELIRGLADVLDAHSEDLLDLAGKVDYRALQEAVAEAPQVGVLLRRLQSRQISQEQIQKLLKEIE